MRKLLMGLALTFTVLAALPAVAFAHVVVSPAQAGVGSRTTFSISVPNEKAVPVTGLRLTIPAGLESVTPTVHSGWTITTSKEGEAVTEIRWDGGTIPTGMRDEFSFRAMAPAKETDLIWKAYQTYADGSTIAWDQDPNPEHSETEGSGPYSVTKVTNDLTTTDDGKAVTATGATRAVNWAFAICLVSLALSVAAFVRYRKK